jgi:hypothetical protein
MIRGAYASEVVEMQPKMRPSKWMGRIVVGSVFSGFREVEQTLQAMENI